MGIFDFGGKDPQDPTEPSLGQEPKIGEDGSNQEPNLSAGEDFVPPVASHVETKPKPKEKTAEELSSDVRNTAVAGLQKSYAQVKTAVHEIKANE